VRPPTPEKKINYDVVIEALRNPRLKNEENYLKAEVIP
jgi:hypothetical protein